MDQDQRCRVNKQSAFQNFAGINRHMIDGANRDQNIGNQPVLAVEIEDMKALDLASHRQRIMPKSA